MSWKSKKLVAVLVTSMLMTKKKTKEELKWISCIQYLVIFKDQTKTLLDSRSKVNVINQAFTS